VAENRYHILHSVLKISVQNSSSSPRKPAKTNTHRQS